jgi:hypothetical protein
VNQAPLAAVEALKARLNRILLPPHRLL